MNAVDLVEDAGFEAVEAANSRQAVRVLESRSDIGIILSDIHMPPGIDGMALVAIVHDRWPLIAIILVSGQMPAGESSSGRWRVFQQALPTDRHCCRTEPDGCLTSRFPLSGFLDAFVEVPLAFPLLPHHDSTAARLKTTKVSGRGKMK